MFQILSLSGGGFLGLYTAAVLAALERHSNARIATHFDLIAGTSIGGIIALALAAEVPAAKIQTTFVENGERIFGTSKPPQTWLSAGKDIAQRFFTSKHNPHALRSTIENIIDADMLIGDLAHPVIIPAVNLSRGAPQLFKTPHHETLKLDRDLRVVDVAMATSAAPTYFPLAKIGSSMYADGGLFANSPDLLAIHEAFHFFGLPEHQLRLLSIGTTTAQFSFAHAKNRSFGIARWFRGARLMNAAIASQQRSVHFMLTHRLQDRYLRLDHEQSKEQERVLGLDVATDEAQGTIEALAESTFQNAVNHPLLATILEHVAAEPRFHS